MTLEPKLSRDTSKAHPYGCKTAVAYTYIEGMRAFSLADPSSFHWECTQTAPMFWHSSPPLVGDRRIVAFLVDLHAMSVDAFDEIDGVAVMNQQGGEQPWSSEQLATICAENSGFAEPLRSTKPHANQVSLSRVSVMRRIAEQSIHVLDVRSDEGIRPVGATRIGQCDVVVAKLRLDHRQQGTTSRPIADDGFAEQPFLQQSASSYAVISDVNDGVVTIIE